MCLFRFIWDAGTKTFTRDTISYDDSVSTGMQIQVQDMDGDKRRTSSSAARRAAISS